MFLQEHLAGPCGRERKCLRSTVLTFHQKLRLSPICVSVPSWPVPPKDHTPHCQWKLPFHTLEWGCVSHCPGDSTGCGPGQRGGCCWARVREALVPWPKEKIQKILGYGLKERSQVRQKPWRWDICFKSYLSGRGVNLELPHFSGLWGDMWR